VTPGNSIGWVGRAVRLVAIVSVVLGLFWAGRESTHGLTAFWEHWWCPVPVALTVAGAAAMLIARPTSPAA